MHNLRSYQTKAVADTFLAWQSAQSVLGVAPTGSGKTVLASDIISQHCAEDDGRKVMVFVHRHELAAQWFDALSRRDLYPEIEKADQRASRFMANIVIATPQTLYSNGSKRLESWVPGEFGLLVVDELHHYVSPKFLSCVEHFRQNKDCKILGITATADRHDGKALGKIIDSVAFEILLIDMITEGWLVAPTQAVARIHGLDLSKCHVVAGDFNQRELEECINEEKNLLEYASSTWQEAKEKRTLVFCQNVKQAQVMSEIFNSYEAGVSACITGKTPDHERDHVFKSFRRGDIRILTNCAVFVEGADVPDIQCVAMCKPTLSRTVYAQSVGRGLRPLSDIARNETLTTAELRREAIRLSHKPTLLVLDFVGNSGRHSLQTTVDLLAGKMFSEEAKKLARKRLEQKRGDPLDELQKAEKEVREEADRKKRYGIRAHATADYDLTYIDPFAAISDHYAARKRWTGHIQRRLSGKQFQRLLKAGFNPDHHSLAECLAKHRELIAASDKQRWFLAKLGAPKDIVEDQGLTRWGASELIDAAVKNGNKWPQQ